MNRNVYRVTVTQRRSYTTVVYVEAERGSLAERCAKEAVVKDNRLFDFTEDDYGSAGPETFIVDAELVPRDTHITNIIEAKE